MVTNWPNKEMRKRSKIKLDTHRPIQVEMIRHKVAIDAGSPKQFGKRIVEWLERSQLL